ncbi:hypothetical protein EAVVTKC53_00597 [Elizabethkingia anophelis]|nr:hypothetical protein EAVVTKC53_01435 [Elizabethkingia anophelis]CAI9678248.1 hypothetical protein EAVVTKC53_00597 [Elizabethkingia anophelis]
MCNNENVKIVLKRFLGLNINLVLQFELTVKDLLSLYDYNLHFNYICFRIHCSNK